MRLYQLLKKDYYHTCIYVYSIQKRRGTPTCHHLNKYARKSTPTSVCHFRVYITISQLLFLDVTTPPHLPISHKHRSPWDLWFRFSFRFWLDLRVWFCLLKFYFICFLNKLIWVKPLGMWRIKKFLFVYVCLLCFFFLGKGDGSPEKLYWSNLCGTNGT